VRVLASVLASDHQLTREEIARSFGRRGVDRVTLYRTLLALEKAGLIARHDRAGEAVWCSHAADTGRRLFFVCRRCGSSAKLEGGLGGLEKSLGRLAEPSGFTVDSRHIEVTGLCGPCGEGDSR
jgi:Fur family ferric uptake transcriptional regulator